MAEGVAGVESAVKRLPWWVFPLAGGGVVAVVLVMKRGSSGTVTAAEQGTPATEQATNTDSGWSGAFDQLQTAISDVATNETNQAAATAASIQQQAANTTASIQQQAAGISSLQATVNALAATVANLNTSTVKAPQTITSNPDKPRAKAEKHHIDSRDKAAHRKRQEKKGQIGHK